MYNHKLPERMTGSFLNCNNRKDFEFLYDMFSANIYEAVYPIVESEEIAEKILSVTFINIRNQQFTYEQNYVGIFTLLLRIAIGLSYNEIKDSNPKKMVYQKLGKIISLPDKQKYS